MVVFGSQRYFGGAGRRDRDDRRLRRNPRLM